MEPNGVIWGYKVTAVVREPTRDVQITQIFRNTTRGILGQLEKYTWYQLKISAINKRGAGIPSPAIVVLTDEDGKEKSPISS